jgi:glycerol-3-phosphate O-acyltransferase
MTSSVALPLWLAALLVVLATWTAVERLLAPGIRWVVRRQTRRVVDEVQTRFHIELPAFKMTRRQVLIDRLVHDRAVLRAADEYARASGERREAVLARVERYAHEIVPAFNAYLYFRVGYWLSRRIATLLYRVRLGYADEAGLAAIRPGATVVFVMNHRSNMDYVLVAYLAAQRAALSYAVGEWARVWPLQSLVRAMGAYFIRRDSGDDLYRCVLARYVAMATAEGVTQAVFPEGGLSRDGRLREPRLGILDYMLRDFDPDGDRDLVFVPVGINYDRTLEDRSLLLSDQDLGERQHASRRRALGTTVRFVGRNLWLIARNRWYRFGYACVNFGTPLSVQDYLRARDLDLRTLNRDERFRHVAAMGADLMAAVGRVIPVLPTALVATVFTRDPHAALDELEIKAGVHRLIGQLEQAGARVYIPRSDHDYAVTVGLRMLVLRRLLRLDDGLFRPHPHDLRLLAYYANSIQHLVTGRGARTGAEPGAKPGAKPGAEPGAEPGAKPGGAGCEPGAEPDVAPGAKPGAEPRTEPGVEPVAGRGGGRGEALRPEPGVAVHAKREEPGEQVAPASPGRG